MTKKFNNWVFPGVADTFASASLLDSMLIIDDFPTFDLPMKANSGNDSSGHESKSGALQSKMADEMFTIINQERSVAANARDRYNQFQSVEAGFNAKAQGRDGNEFELPSGAK